MLVDAGVKYVVLGHSERRDYFGETNEDVNKKSLKAFEHGIHRSCAVGDSGAERTGRNNGFHSPAGKSWIPECNS